MENIFYLQLPNLAMIEAFFESNLHEIQMRSYRIVSSYAIYH